MQVSNDHAVIVVARLLMSLDDACPDVGMGMFWQTAVAQAIELLDIEKEDVSPEVFENDKRFS